jgi:chromosome partitioning protein
MVQVITVAQQKGGAGKTTLAVHLAVAWSQRGKRVALIDTDPQGSLTHWYRLREERFGEGYTGLAFAALPGWRVASEIQRLKREHDLIIIDSPPHMETEARTGIRHADLIVIPVQPSPTDLWATKATVDLAHKERIPVRIVLNRVPPKGKLAGIVSEQLTDIATQGIGNRIAFATSLFEGRTVTETQPHSPASKEIKALIEELWKALPHPEEAGEEIAA